MAQCRTTLSDTNFAALGGPAALGYSQEFQGEGVPGYFRVTRVVEPGTTSEFTQAASPTVPLGTLINASTYVQNGIVSSPAYLQVTGSMTVNNQFWGFATLAGLGTAADLEVTFTLNGVKISHPYALRVVMNASSPPVTSTPFYDCIPVPANLIRLAQKTAGQTCPTYSHYNPPTDTTCAGLNELEAHFRFRLLRGLQPNVDPSAGLAALPFLDLGHSPATVQAALNSINTFVRGLTLSFKAMSPVMMVHGFNANQDLFTSASLNFVQPFINAKIPYSIVTNPGVLFKGALALGEGTIYEIGQVLRSQIPNFAGTFGANKVHIIAHSKGSLYSRYFLQQGGPYSANVYAALGPATANNFGVFSLYTLDTPHHGSAGADIKTAYKLAKETYGFVTPFIIALAIVSVKAPGGAGVVDLTTSAVSYFNSTFPRVPYQFQDTDGRVYPTRYRALFSNADANGDNKISVPELEGFSVQDTVVGSLLYQAMGWVKRVIITRVAGKVVGVVVPNFGFEVNDLIVTATSAKYPQFTDFSTVPFSKNHSNIGKPDIGTLILNDIKALEGSIR